MHTVNAIGNSIDARSAGALLSNLEHEADLRLLSIIAAAVSDGALRPVSPERRDAVRAAILKSCLVQLM